MNKTTFYTNVLLFFVILVILIKFIFELSGYKFLVEFLILLGILIIGFIGILLTYNNIRIGYVLNSIVTAVALLNFIAIFIRSNNMTTVMFAAIICAMTAFVINVIHIGTKKRKVKKITKKVKQAIKKTHSPGKFISSKSGTTFHAPKCDWAKRIKRQNRVWWESTQKAKKAGLKKHSCLG